MEVKNTDINKMDCANKEDDDVLLPGFRFHPTDEELVGFYLRRKIEKKSFTIDLIKHVDIYKFDPWDLPKGSNLVDKEWYFFCKRGRKYRNSVRPNRVTSSGFWKATGIDRPIYSTTGAKHQCIGLKKSLVYYRGSAGKGTKTEWMMHEFRLPADHDDKSTKHIDVKKITTQEAEVWTLCRILKRSTLTKKCMPDWRDLSSAKKSNITPSINASSITCSADSETSYEEGYKIDFRTPKDTRNYKKSFASLDSYEANQICSSHFSSLPRADSMAMYSNYYYPNVNELIKTGGWDELKSAMEFDLDLSYM